METQGAHRLLLLLRQAGEGELRVGRLRGLLAVERPLSVIRLFDALDTTHAGAISVDDVHAFLATAGGPCTKLREGQAGVAGAVRQHDRNADGRLCLVEFVSMLCGGAGLGTRAPAISDETAAADEETALLAARVVEAEVGLYAELERERRVLLDVFDVTVADAWQLLAGTPFDAASADPKPGGCPRAWLTTSAVGDAFTTSLTHSAARPST